MQVNLLSDTVTLPSAAMKEAMLTAPLGDDVFGQDPTVNALESHVAELFGHEAALFCPSGTMTNQIAIQLHTGRTDAIICEAGSHIYQYETGGYAYNAGVAVDPIEGEFGKITAKQISQAIRPRHDWYQRSRLVVLENTCNRGGGTIYTIDEVAPIRTLCQEQNLTLHLDGARLFNALVATGETTTAWGRAFDSISICLSKGLGAPVGSLLIGSQAFIQEGRRLRKIMGGGMRQAGILAAAGIFALNRNVQRLAEDHRHARLLANSLSGLARVRQIRPVETNIVIFEVMGSAQDTVDLLASHDILAAPMGPSLVRFVTHMDVTAEMIQHCIAMLPQILD